jgi:hypothetical protein
MKHGKACFQVPAPCTRALMCVFVCLFVLAIVCNLVGVARHACARFVRESGCILLVQFSCTEEEDWPINCRVAEN